ncbi:DUF1367 family protein [Pantoea osteomyelitidis]|uniref:DUF1367 family protein n=1 Tax=Pantoea osteomyelitidis TaxID=3230026 RepID=A0ABW7PV64_9GAMM
MAQIYLIKTSSEFLAPANPGATEYIQGLKSGVWLNCDVRQARNYLFHKRFFSLLKFGYEYWTPSGGALTPEEQHLLNGFVSFLCKAAGTGYKTALADAAEHYLNEVTYNRTKDMALLKSFDAFREWVTVQAGFYSEHIYPDGSRGRRAKSVSFAQMDEPEFRQLYKSVLNVLWNYILFRKFPSYQAAESAAAQLLEYAA